MVESTSLLMKRPGQTGPQVQILSSPFFFFVVAARFLPSLRRFFAVHMQPPRLYSEQVGGTL